MGFGPLAVQVMLMISIISYMNIAATNLNLLVAFEALFEERNVTRAALRVGVTQPAMSNNLAQLRRLFDDPLFRRTARGLEPTPRAIELADPLRQGLRLIGSTLEPRSFDPRQSERTFVIAASDYAEFLLMPQLMRKLTQDAPKVSIQIIPWGLLEVPPFLARGEADLMIGFYNGLPKHHLQDELFDEEYVCIVRRNHPLVNKRLSLKTYLALEHVLVSQVKGSQGSVDRALAEQGLERRIAARVSHTLMVPTLIARTDLVAAVSRRIADAFAAPLRLRTFAPPLPLPRSTVGQVWHEQADTDPAHRWLRGVVREVAQRLG